MDKWVTCLPAGRKYQRGDAGMLYVIVIMLSLIAFSFFLAGGTLPSMTPAITAPPPGKQEIIFDQVPNPGKQNLQLQTFKVKNSCESKIAVDFLIDISGSMAFGGGIKQSNEKNALNAFTAKMVDSSVIGIQTFSDPELVRENVPLSYYKDAKSQVENTINSLPAQGATSTRDAFNLAKDKLSAAITQNKFPGYKYSLVFITDGVPEANPPVFDSQHCDVIVPDTTVGQRCFAKAQDPRGTPTDSTNLGTVIKNMGVEVYSLAITTQNSSDQQLLPYLTALLQNVASPPLSTHFYSSDNGSDLKTQLDSVFKNICT